MKNYRIKFNHIFPAFLIVSLSTILGLSVLRWLTTIKFDAVHLKLEIWNIFLAIGIPGAASFIFLRPKFNLLVFKDDDKKGRELFTVIACVVIAIPTVLSQQYFTKTFSDLSVVDNIEGIAENNTLFYKIKNYYVAPVFASNVDGHVVGRRFNKKWSMSAYFVFPISTSNEAKKIDEYKYWYGVKFDKDVDYTWSEGETRAKEEAFLKKCRSELRWDHFKNVNYFERLSESFERDNFREALEAKIGSQAFDKEILVPKNGTPPLGDHEKLIWALVAYCIGVGTFLLLLDWPGYSTIELEKRQKKR